MKVETAPEIYTLSISLKTLPALQGRAVVLS